MFLAVSQQNSGTKVQTGTKEQEQVQGYFLPPYGPRYMISPKFSHFFIRPGQENYAPVLEYFYVERPLGSDGLFGNWLIGINNILTGLEILVLLLATRVMTRRS